MDMQRLRMYLKMCLNMQDIKVSLPMLLTMFLKMFLHMQDIQEQPQEQQQEQRILGIKWWASGASRQIWFLEMLLRLQVLFLMHSGMAGTSWRSSEIKLAKQFLPRSSQIATRFGTQCPSTGII